MEHNYMNLFIDNYKDSRHGHRFLMEMDSPRLQEMIFSAVYVVLDKVSSRSPNYEEPFASGVASYSIKPEQKTEFHVFDLIEGVSGHNLTDRGLWITQAFFLHEISSYVNDRKLAFTSRDVNKAIAVALDMFAVWKKEFLRGKASVAGDHFGSAMLFHTWVPDEFVSSLSDEFDHSWEYDDLIARGYSYYEAVFDIGGNKSSSFTYEKNLEDVLTRFSPKPKEIYFVGKGRSRQSSNVFESAKENLKKKDPDNYEYYFKEEK